MMKTNEEEGRGENIFQNLESHLENLDSKNKQDAIKDDDTVQRREPALKAKTSLNLSWLTSVKKVSTSIANSRLFAKGEGDILFCCSVDGSKHSDFAFELITENFMFPYTKLLCTHIYNSKLDPVLNYNNKRTTVLEKYASKIERFKKQSHFVTEDRTSKIHALEQANKLAENYAANFLVCGYQGLKGPRGCNKEQGFGHDFLLSSSKTPIILVKEDTKRSDKNGSFKWLVVMDKQHTFTMKAFTSFLPLIDPEKDVVHGNGFYPSGSLGTDVLKDQFIQGCEKNGVKNFEYEQLSYSDKKPIYQFVTEKVNFGTVNYDFIIIYNHAGKFKADPEKSDVSNLIKGTTTNICFVNS